MANVTPPACTTLGMNPLWIRNFNAGKGVKNGGFMDKLLAYKMSRVVWLVG
jgi:hypothetical protein